MSIEPVDRIPQLIEELRLLVRDGENSIQLRKLVAKELSDSRMLGTGNAPLFEANSIASQIRHHVDAMKTVVDGKTQRKALLRNSLRMAGLIGAGKKRK